ncbi:MAG: hypothetical protein Q7R80_00805, partial [bacterium]|nr:hypothetical protein [bacterium]
MAKNLTYSDRQAGELQRTSSVRVAQPEEVASASLPEVGATVALDHYGTCEVLRHELGLGGIVMIALRCTSAGRKTFIGQEFKLSGPLVARLHTAHRQYVVDEQLTRFFGRVTTDIAHLGPSAWLTFLRWFQAVQPDTLPVAEEPQQSQGPIAELYTLHERTLRGFATQPPVDQHVSFVVTIERRKKIVSVTDDIPAEEIGRIASAIASEPAEDHAWRRYRRFVASSVPRLVDKTRQIVRYTVDRQQEWLRTGRLLEQQRLTRSS